MSNEQALVKFTPYQFVANVFTTTDAQPRGGLVAAARRLEQLGIGDWEMSMVFGTPMLKPGRAIGGHQFQSPDAAWTLRVLPGVVSLIHDLANASTALAPFPEFIERAVALLGNYLQHYDKKAKRLSTIQNVFVGDIPESEETHLAARFLRLSPSFQSTSKEWDFRAVSRSARSFGGTEEGTNTIASVQRSTFEFRVQVGSNAELPVLSVDGLGVSIDINTAQERREERFSAEVASDFFRRSAEWQGEVFAELEAQIRGSGDR